MKQARHQLDDVEVQQTAFECLITAQFNRKKRAIQDRTTSIANRKTCTP